MYGCEIWAIKTAKHWRIDAFELWCWRRLLRVIPWTARRSNLAWVHPKGNHSWIFIGKTDAEGKLQYFGYLMWRAESFEKTLVLGKIEYKRRRGRQRMRWLDHHPTITKWWWMASATRWIWVWASSWSWWWTGKPGVLQSIGSQRVGHDWAAELNWNSEQFKDILASFLKALLSKI